MLSYLYNILFNPYLVSFRLWINLYKLFVNLFEIVDNDEQRLSAVLPLVYSVSMSSLSPYSIFMLINNVNSKSELINNIVYYGSVGYFTVNMIVGNMYYRNIINSNRLGYIYRFINIGMFVHYRYINKFEYLVLGLPFQIPMIIKYYIKITNVNANISYKIHKLLYLIFRLLYSVILIFFAIKYKMNDLLLYLIGIFVYFLYNY
jgi:hypothetical protein